MNPMTRGTTHHFDQDLTALKEKLITMGSLAEAAVRRSMKALGSLVGRRRQDPDSLDDLKALIPTPSIKIAAQELLQKLLVLGL